MIAMFKKFFTKEEKTIDLCDFEPRLTECEGDKWLCPSCERNICRVHFQDKNISGDCYTCRMTNAVKKKPYT